MLIKGSRWAINKFKLSHLITFLFVAIFGSGKAGNQPKNLLPVSYITIEKGTANFISSSSGISAQLVLNANDYPGVIRIDKYLQEDIFKVTQANPRLIMGEMPQQTDLVIIGTIGKSRLIDSLVEQIGWFI